jgi:nicotinamide riboside kinase
VEGILSALQRPALGPMTRAKLVGDASGALCVWLVARRHILNWPVGLLNNLFFFLIFWRSKLYGDAVLQASFAALAIYGWWEWARERGRAQLEGRTEPAIEELSWPSEAFEAIAAEQNRREDAQARAGGPVLVCDTDAFATGVWHERYLGWRSPAVEEHGRKHALYLLTHPDDVPFVQDGLRDGEAIRLWMTEVFAARLQETGRRWRWLRGSSGQRLVAALAEIEERLAEGWHLADPLG